MLPYHEDLEQQLLTNTFHHFVNPQLFHQRQCRQQAQRMGNERRKCGSASSKAISFRGR